MIEPKVAKYSPSQLIYVRHGESEYNRFKEDVGKSPVYKKFKTQYDKEWGSIISQVKEGSINTALIDILSEKFPSEYLKTLAYKFIKEFPQKSSSFDTKLSRRGIEQSLKTGRRMRDLGFSIPDVIFVSPYARTKQTLENLIKGWPELKNVRIVEYLRLREQEHGVQDLFNNGKVANVFMPRDGLFKLVESGYTFRYSNGESLLDVIDRHSAFLKHLYRKYLGKKVMIVGHHLGLLSIMSILEDWSREKFLYEDGNNTPINAGVSVFEPKDLESAGGKLECKSYNQKLY